MRRGILGPMARHEAARQGSQGNRSDLVTLIRAKRAQITKLKDELDEALRELREELGEAPPRPALARRSESRPAVKPQPKLRYRRPPPEIRGSDVLPADSAAFYAAQAIKGVGRPLHVRDMLKAAEQAGHKIKKTTLVGSLSRWVTRRVFYRAGPNVFGLAEMRKG